MLNQNPQQTDFVLGTCPHCQKVVRIPVTAVTSQSSSQVGCPICSKSFELASVLEEMIPAVKVVDDEPTSEAPIAPPTQAKKPQRINAIDTPELFHSISKEDYEPITEKKNGRFVVPDLLSKGIDKKKKKKRKSRRRRSSDDPDVARSLAKLKENTASTSLEPAQQYDSNRDESERREDETSERKSSRKKSRSGSQGRSSSRKRSQSTRSSNKVRTSQGLGNTILAIPRRFRRMFKNNLSSDSEKESTTGDMIMLALGAMIAIPMLHLVLWWLAGLDPLGLAKPTSRIVPFLVPRSLKTDTDATTTVPAEPSKQTILDEENFFESNVRSPAQPTADGKLPKPNIDPASVHVDDVN